MAVPYQFSNQTGPIPLTELDANFNSITSSPAISGNATFTDNSANPAVTITQSGAGKALDVTGIQRYRNNTYGAGANYDTASETNKFFVGVTNSSTAFIVRDVVNNATRMAISPTNGNVGFGLPSTVITYALEVYRGSASAAIRVRSADTASASLILSGSIDGSYSNWVLSANGPSNGTNPSKLTLTAQSTVIATFDNSGNLGLGTTSPTAQVDVSGDKLRVRTAKTPASAGATGNAGDICWDSNYVYICVATNTWKRAALSTW